MSSPHLVGEVTDASNGVHAEVLKHDVKDLVQKHPCIRLVNLLALCLSFVRSNRCAMMDGHDKQTKQTCGLVG
jgi:hypothetical protein